MKELFKSLKKALALWIITHQDLICACITIYCTTLAYLQMGVYCLTLPYQFVKLVAQNMKKAL
jgi:hypothetical protein